MAGERSEKLGSQKEVNKLYILHGRLNPSKDKKDAENTITITSRREEASRRVPSHGSRNGHIYHTKLK
jgi:hypothetical protein